MLKPPSAPKRETSRDETSDRNPDYQWIQAELTKAQADLSGLKARAAAAAATAAKYHAQAHYLDHAMIVQQNLQQAAKTEEENYLHMCTKGNRRASAMLLTAMAS